MDRNFATCLDSGNLVVLFVCHLLLIAEPNTLMSITHLTISSGYLQREVTVSVLLPLTYNQLSRYPVLLVNDGQDFNALGMAQQVQSLTAAKLIREVLVVGIHANEDRLQEYGIAASPDYAGRGGKAACTTDFVMHELIPWLKKQYFLAPEKIVYAGFSLGGLMALDIAWNHSNIFSHVAVFSGALWWRSIALDAGYTGGDRIMHKQIRESAFKPGLKFWFQTGTKDETDDRDRDGVIDSIQDTLESISELERKGYRWGVDVSYTEVQGGYHNQETWASVIPDFLIWAFGIKAAVVR
jgi:enterochelin esterase-like enzyme